MTEIQAKQGHPGGLYLLFFTEMWERFSYYGMRAILILFLTKKFVEGGLAMDPATATLLYGNFTGLVYATPLIGGWLADKYIGKRNAITIGGILMMLGQFALFSIDATNQSFLGMDASFGLYTGLFLLIIGNGFFKPNISTLVGGLYKDGDGRKDSAFTIFYMGINLGALIAPLVIGLLTDNIFATKGENGEIVSYGYRYGFLAAGIGMLLGQILFNTFAQKYLGDLGKRPVDNSILDVQEETVTDHGVKPEHAEISASESEITPKQSRDRVTVIFILFLFAIFFWAGFEQAGSSLSLYTDNYIDRTVFGWEIPTSFFQSVNPLFIIMLAPLFATFWNSRLGKKLTTPVKMGLGMIILGIGFFFMLGAVAERGGDVADTAVKANIMWLVMTYLLHTVGELCISPVGLSVVTKLSPPKLASLLMAVWLLSSAIANKMGGELASVVEKLGAGTIFLYISIFVICCGVLLITLNKKIVSMMHGLR